MEYIRVLFLLYGCIPRTQGSVELTEYQTGSAYTLMCRSLPGSQTINWFRNNELVIRTRDGSRGRCGLEHNPSDTYTTYLSGRVSVSCDAAQHNVSLTTTSPTNSGSVWQCENTSRDKSNRLTIETSPKETPPNNTPGSIFSTTSGGTPGTSTATTTMLTTKPETSTMASERDMATDHLAPAPVYSNVGEEIQENETVLEENDLYEGSVDITPSRQLTEIDHAVTDVYAEVRKPKKATTAQADKAEYVNMKEL
ncbi:uncharacterized protein LOC124271130 isoform X1 [Haliotis rubra]|uniref:uncharacterized protein LOC124271130 isoform X1 n=1 Tax=Haliotis rubra TaxID=36100 RepID=UPI001EE5375A|nr:uncharacterized protein LOC124271130 isoform X1 [Haliotis rubra]